MSAELAAGVLAVACLVFLWVLSKRDKFPLSWLAKTILAAFAGAGIAATSIGAWIAGWIGWLADLIGGIPSWFGFSLVVPGVILSSIVTVVLVFFAVYGLRDKSADKPELVAWIAAPLVALAAIGPIASAVSDNISPAVREAGSSTIGRMIGGG
jgi:hypothetical protein